LLILLLMGAANHLPTRYWPSAVLFAAGQGLIVAPWLPVVWFQLPSGETAAAALGLWLTSLLIACWLSRPTADVGLQRVWFDFRDAFGAVWGLRVIERVNAAASAYEWPVRLSWHGFETLDGDAADHLPAETTRNVSNVLANLLRRFVSTEWIEMRMASAGARPPIE